MVIALLGASATLALVLPAVATANAVAEQRDSVSAAPTVSTVEVVPATLPTDLPLAATVYGFDAGGNLVGNITSQSVLSIAPDGSCSAGHCYGTSPGAHTVTAVYGSGPAQVVGTGNWTLFAGPAASVAVITGDHQLAARGTRFPTAVRVRVTDTDRDAVGGYLVQWAVTRGSARFPGGSSHAQSLTGTASGTATAPRLTAGGSSGPVTLTASINSRTAEAHLLVYAAPLTVSVTAGNHQLIQTGKQFPTRLRTTVTDAAHQHLRGLAVTWRVTTGSARFTGGATHAASTTSNTGQALAPTLAAGRTTGPVTVTATTAGARRTATYHLVIGRPPSMTSPTSDNVAVPVAPSPSAAGAELAVTGVNAGQQAALGTALLLAGILMLLATQARSRRWPCPSGSRASTSGPSGAHRLRGSGRRTAPTWRRHLPRLLR